MYYRCIEERAGIVSMSKYVHVQTRSTRLSV